MFHIFVNICIYFILVFYVLLPLYHYSHIVVCGKACSVVYIDIYLFLLFFCCHCFDKKIFPVWDK